MITFIIGLFIGGFFGSIFASMFATRRKEPKCLDKKNISESLDLELPLDEKYQGEKQQAI